jgi:pimeloyl-ACP methyl ester carboxylesterase
MTTQRATALDRTVAGLAADNIGCTDQRPPLVLLHGTTFDRTMWRPALEALQEVDPDRRILSLDLPGHGGSPDAAAYDPESLGIAVRRAVEEAGLEAPVVVGHSSSGIGATMYASRYPTRGVVNVDQPLFVAPFIEGLKSLAPLLRGPGWRQAWDMMAAGFHTEELPPAARHLVESSSRPSQELLLGYWQDLIDRPTADTTAFIDGATAAIKASGLPYVYVAGDEPSPEYRAWLARAIPQARVDVYQRGGHFPHLADPARFAGLLAETARWA